MPLLSNPLPLPLSHLGVRPEMFRRYSAVHGAGHVNRVIFHTLCLCKNSGLQELMPAAWAAAHLHDLARAADGPCTRHGIDAVEQLLPRYLPLYLRGGVKACDIPAITTAVALHCTEETLPRDHPHFNLWALLTDADALDRVRLGDLDVTRLRYNRSAALVPLASTLERLTGPHASFESVWEIGTQLANPHRGFAEGKTPTWDPHEGGRPRMLRRISQGHHYSCVQIFEPFWSDEMPPQFAIQGLISELEERVRGYNWDRVWDLANHKIARFAQVGPRLTPVTGTRNAKRFFEQGDYKSFWEAGPSWHNRYHDAPSDTRALTDYRLFGELGSHTTYGILVDPEDPSCDASLETLNQTYGDQHLWWKPEILQSCSFCLNDSMDQGVVLPFSVSAWVKAATIRSIVDAAQLEVPLELFPFRNRSMFFWEFQCHELLTTDAVSKYTDPVLQSA